VCLKNICDGVGRQNGLNGTPLDPPLYWLDNILSSFRFKVKEKNTFSLQRRKIAASKYRHYLASHSLFCFACLASFCLRFASDFCYLASMRNKQKVKSKMAISHVSLRNRKESVLLSRDKFLIDTSSMRKIVYSKA
jgi:hypothetical protein